MKVKHFIWVAIICLIPLTGSISAGTVTFELITEFSGATPPAGAAPWLTAVFDDGGSAGSVTATLSASGLTGNEFVSEWLFNLNPAIDPSLVSVTFTDITDIGGVTPGLTQSTDCCKADGDGFFDLRFAFPKGSDKFGAGDVVVITFTAPGLLASDFFYRSTGAGNSADGLYTAAHVQGIGPSDDDSGWITVPEPATALLFSTCLVGLGILRQRVSGKELGA